MPFDQFRVCSPRPNVSGPQYPLAGWPGFAKGRRYPAKPGHSQFWPFLVGPDFRKLQPGYKKSARSADKAGWTLNIAGWLAGNPRF